MPVKQVFSKRALGDVDFFSPKSRVTGKDVPDNFLNAATSKVVRFDDPN